MDKRPRGGPAGLPADMWSLIITEKLHRVQFHPKSVCSPVTRGREMDSARMSDPEGVWDPRPDLPFPPKSHIYALFWSVTLAPKSNVTLGVQVQSSYLGPLKANQLFCDDALSPSQRKTLILSGDMTHESPNRQVNMARMLRWRPI